MEEGKSAFKILTGIPAGKRPLRRPRRRWADLQEIGINTRNWVYSAQDRGNWKAIRYACGIEPPGPYVMELVG